MTTHPRFESNVVPFKPKDYPSCPRCSHTWHGLPCASLLWPKRGTSGTCPCDSSLDTEPGGDAA